MKQVMIYDPATAERVHEGQTARMMDSVNRNHERAMYQNAVLSVAAMSRQQMAALKAHHTRQEARLYTQLEAEKKKARAKARRCKVSMEAVLAATTVAFVKGATVGLIHWSVTVPVAAICLLVGAWIAGGLWQEVRSEWKGCR